MNPCPSDSEVTWLMSGNRKVIGVLTDHCRLRSHLHLLFIKASPICRNCLAAEESIYHFLGICVRLQEKLLGSTTISLSSISSLIMETGRLSEKISTV